MIEQHQDQIKLWESPSAKLNKALTAIIAATGATTGEGYYHALSENLSQVLEVRHILIAEVFDRVAGQPTKVRTLSFWNTGKLVKNVVYDLAGTPCEHIFTKETLTEGQGVCYFPTNLQELFPLAPFLQVMEGESYLGVTLIEPVSNQPIGHICLVDDKPLKDETYHLAASVMSLFASRIVAEMERQTTFVALQASEVREREKAQQLEQALSQLKQAQLQIIQKEKMSALGDLVAGVAHEINNPVSCIVGNLEYAQQYVQDLFSLIDLYQQEYPFPTTAIKNKIQDIELDYLQSDLPKLISSLQEGTNRICNISSSLRIFSRGNSTSKVAANIHQGIDSTLMILQHRIKVNAERPAIQVIKNYGDLPPVKCYLGQLNQVFMNILVNAIDALEEKYQKCHNQEITAYTINISTTISEDKQQVVIKIADNGLGISEEVKLQIFDHLFTTKALGKGTGLGLSISKQIVEEMHGGKLQVVSDFGKGTEFILNLPLF